MCTYITHQVSLTASSAKGPEGWIPVIEANVYFDHPFHAPLDHAVTIDFTNPEKGPSSRLAVELSPESARELADAIMKALATGEADHLIEAAVR